MGSIAYLTCCYGDVSVIHKHILLSSGELTVIPVVDNIVETIFLVADGYLLVCTKFILRSAIRIVGIAVWHHIQQGHLTMRS